MTLAGRPRAAGLAGAIALVLAPVTAEAAAAPPVCPDAGTVQAARLVEFQTMMMGVAVRCRHVGIPISDHLEGMNAARRTVLASANERVAAFLRGLNTSPAAAPPVADIAAPNKPTAGAKASLAAKPATGTAAKNGKPQKAAPGTVAAAAPAASAPAASAKPAAKISRRTDPYDRYLTMIGNQYGAGVTTLQRCKAFDTIVMSVADKTNTDRLLTMVSSSLVQATLLEAIVNCPAKK